MKDKNGKKAGSEIDRLATDSSNDNPAMDNKVNADLIVVGIGASAGGLDALRKLLPGLPVKVGMAFVVVQHLAPKYISVLPSLLAKYSDMLVETITDGMQVRPDTIYITPPNKNVAFSDGRLMLKSRGRPSAPNHPSTPFFNPWPKKREPVAVGIILSGTGMDGAHGIRAIKSNEGITMAQTADSARFDGMPLAAIQTGLVDLVLPPEKIGEGLQTALKYPHLIVKVPKDKHLDEIGTILDTINQKSRDRLQ